MARAFRLYGKKRGHRRTGSNVWGSAGEAIFFACILAAGAVALVRMLDKVIVPEWRVNKYFVETTCVVRYVEVGVDGQTYAPEIKIEYDVEGQKHVAWTYDIATRAYSDVKLLRFGDKAEAQAAADQFEKNGEYPGWYDPADPDVAVLVRGYTWWLWLLLVVPVAFIAIGGARLIYTLIQWGKSAERIAARQRVGALEIPDEESEQARKFPFVPRPANMTNSPGTALAYRLPIHTSQGLRLFAFFAVGLIWNVIVISFLTLGVLRGDWRLLLFCAPFLLAGIALVYYFVRQFLHTTGIGTTQLEISEHPLTPGGRYEMMISQAGRLHVRSLEAALVCEEEASYHQGTDVRVERRRVYEQQVFCRREIDIQPGMPFEERFDLATPAGAMHSFQADHNEIQWKLVVNCDAEHWSPFQRIFPLIVYPSPPKAAREATAD